MDNFQRKFKLNLKNGSIVDASIILSFNFNTNDYLVYAIDESQNNCQIFVSKLIKNSSNNYFIDDITLDEKDLLSKIVYNLIILIPTNVQKGIKFDNIFSDIFKNLNLIINKINFNLESQNYCTNSSIAITNKSLVNSALTIYFNNSLSENNLPIWSISEQLDQSYQLNNSSNYNLENNLNKSFTNNPSDAGIDLSNSVDAGIDLSNNSDTEIEKESVENSFTKLNNIDTNFAIVKDSSLNKFGVKYDENSKKNFGFANSKYIIIGTVCLILSVIIVVATSIIIKNLS